MTQTMNEETLTNVPVVGFGFTEEIQRALSAPVPASEIQTRNQGGATLRYTSDEFIYQRLNDVVGAGGWNSTITITPQEPFVHHAGRKDETLIVGELVYSLTVLGVTKSAAVSMEEVSDMYGDPATNGQARALKRAAMQFGIAAELWNKAPASDNRSSANQGGASTQSRTAARSNGNGYQNQKPAARSNGAGGGKTGEYKAPSEGQVKWLGNLGVPDTIIDQINAAGGKQSEASRLMDALFQRRNPDQDGYDSDPLTHIEEALDRLELTQYIPLLNGGDNDPD